MNAATLAVYVHFPFCLSICPYCDFDRQATGFDRIDAYLASMLVELEQFRGEQRSVHSVFVGGGTPSLMRPDQVAQVLEAIGGCLHLQREAEITLECNPGDADLEKLRGFREAGANRLSFGVQSLDDAMLPMLGRRHSAADAVQSLGIARQAGFDNLSIDLMFGLPGQSLRHWESTLERALELGTQHLSCYLLTLDDRVQMGRDVARGALVLPEDDDLAEMYARTREQLAAAGYEQYEVSNWCRPGHESTHNLTYWRDDEWIGIGAGAASSYRGRRWKNTPVLERYIASISASGSATRVEDEEPDRPTQMLDFLTLGLRLREGVALATFERRFAVDLLQVLDPWLLEVGLLTLEDGRLRVASEHQLVLNEILARVRESVSDYARRETSASQIAAR